MFEFAKKHPIGFEIILIVVAFIIAGIFTAVGSILYLPSELSTSIGRIIVGIALILIYSRAFKDNASFTNGLVYTAAVLLIVFWNIFYNLSSGLPFGGASFFAEAAITAAAPAIFEEVIFRGIFIYNLKESGASDGKCLYVSALLFSLIHLTNIVGGDVASTLLQVVYSFVIGLFLGAVYLKNRNLLQVILCHFLIDFSNRIYDGQSTTANTMQMVVFAVVLILLAVYSLYLFKKKED